MYSVGSFLIQEIMVVDDDPIVRTVATKILKGIDFNGTISSFENGRLAIDEIQRRIAGKKSIPNNDRTLLLLDINMPIMDAWGFLDIFSSLDQKVKEHFYVVIITSSIDSNDRLKAFTYPDVIDYINKPMSGKHITDFLNKHHLLELQSGR
jgi:CheY-like chemotaxis protein